MKGFAELSNRMKAVAELVTPGNRVCDVGCDHGYVSIYLVQTKKTPKVLAMDVNQGPLATAKEHIVKFGVEDYIDLRLSDGLSNYQTGEAETLICAGVGGRLLMEILEKAPEKTADFQELILQPQSEIPLFRSFLRKKGYTVVAEDMVWEEGKFYPMMKAVPHKGKMNTEKNKERYSLEDRFGPLLLKERNPVLLQFIMQEKQVKESILKKLEDCKNKEKIEKRRRELREDLEYLRQAADLFTK